MSGGKGKKAGESPKKTSASPTDDSRKRPRQQDPGASTSGDPTRQVARGGYRTQELRTIPSGVTVVSTDKKDLGPCRPIKALSNFVEISPMKERQVYQYRVDFEPNVESAPLRRRAFFAATEGLFSQGANFDGMYDARSSDKLSKPKVEKLVELPGNKEIPKVTVTVKLVGTVAWQSFEMLRLYNTNMKTFLRALGFFQVSQAGAYVHSALKTELNDFKDIYMVRGFRTAVNVHESDRILMNLEPVHKLMQAHNVLNIMLQYRGQPRLQENIRVALTGKLVVTSYNQAVYRIEDVNFGLSPSSTFMDDKANKEITYKTYFKRRYDLNVSDENQPLLQVVPNNQRKAERETQSGVKVIYLIPEFCNLAGLTDQQRNDNRLKFTLIQTSQVHPKDRVSHMRQFLNKFHSSVDVVNGLRKWGYNYASEPLEVLAKVFPPEPVSIGRNARGPKESWPKLDQSASFESALTRDGTLAVTPRIARMAVFIARPDFRNQEQIIGELRKGFQRVNLRPESVKTIEIKEGDSPHNYVSYLRQLEDSVDISIVIMNRQNKERYDAIKKLCTVERGLTTQVVTARLMTDARKAGGAALKIGVQVAAKVGGEPWYVDIPLKNSMICGYDTYHDTAKRGRSFGAFVATTNDKFSKWFSKADSHDRLDELSAQVAMNMQAAMKKYNAVNKRYPDRVFLYRDGVSEGQIEHVYNVELTKIRDVLKQLKSDIKFTMIIVSKRIGARFYAKQGDTFGNLPPGSVVDDVVTRRERYDFYLVSQHTRAGTVTPTYYNIIHDESGLAPHIHQAMAFKLSMMYYNWTGTVRVPAPCQYAHKLALLCGEHLHASPSSNLDDKLHFL